MTSIKSKISEIVQYTSIYQSRSAKKYFAKTKEHYAQLKSDEQSKQYRFVPNPNNKVQQICGMLDQIKIMIRSETRFQTWIDTGLYVSRYYSMTDNVPPYYPIILDNSLNELIDQYQSKSGEYYSNQMKLLQQIIFYIHRIIAEIDKEISVHPEHKNLVKTRQFFERMIDQKTESFEEALQRILFWSSLFWQSQHQLVGLGRLDKILEKYDLNGENSVDLISDFYHEMHRYYAFKSGTTSLGDTGQIVILGGLEADGSYFCNHLTYNFIKAIKQCHLPDPKVLLRVSEKTPDDLLKLAIECISTGIGCPLLANDDVIIPALEKFGYEKDDACNYVTSACWEPLVYGNSLEKNNLRIINFAEPFSGLLGDKDFETIKDFDSLKNKYLYYLDFHIADILKQLKEVRWEQDPIASLLTIGCFEKGMDISKGGAKYNDYGILSVGMANAVNALFSLKRLAFVDKKYTLNEIKTALSYNFQGYEQIRSDLQSIGYFGKDDRIIIDTVNEITSYVEQKLIPFKNQFSGNVKFGLSSSNYVEAAKSTPATPDGRLANTPLRAHITCSSGVTYSELLNFASEINYDGLKSNGNVVDFFVAPSFLQANFDKFVLLIRSAIRNGFFEMQMNVVSSATLIDAKKYPEKYPDLIVRVWGFSAYFKDLPEEYQNVLIERAVQSESVA